MCVCVLGRAGFPAHTHPSLNISNVALASRSALLNSSFFLEQALCNSSLFNAYIEAGLRVRFDKEILVTIRLDKKRFKTQYFQLKENVCHIVALPFTLKSILRQMKNDGNSNISPCQNIIFKKIPLKETKILQDIITLYKLISSFNTSQNIIFQKCSYKKRPIIIT